MNTLYFITSALVPAAIIISIFYFLDKNKEPAKLVIKAFFAGGIAIPVTYMFYMITPAVRDVDDGSFWSALLNSFYNASLHEELAKLSVFIAFVYRQKDFDEWYDGVLYGICIGTGFAFVENIMYFFDYFHKFGTDIIYDRSIFPMPTHALCGGIMGFYIAKAKFTSIDTKEIEYWIAAFLYPFLVHGIYDFVLMYKEIDISFLMFAVVAFLWIKVLKLKKHTQTKKVDEGIPVSNETA